MLKKSKCPILWVTLKIQKKYKKNVKKIQMPYFVILAPKYKCISAGIQTYLQFGFFFYVLVHKSIFFNITWSVRGWAGLG